MQPSLHFMLKVRQFIEMVSGQDTAFDDENNINITATLRYDNFLSVVDKNTLAPNETPSGADGTTDPG